MKTLKRIKLINWHLFCNQTIEINGNCLLSGENGAGKSTFLDALQYVLTGGRAKFNTAANTNAKRDLEGYIRCKTGVENKTYLRNQDVISHIALEFTDSETNESVILGVILEINKHGKIYEHFYVLNNRSITDDLYVRGDVILGFSMFKKNLLQLGLEGIFTDTKEGTRKLFLNTLGMKNYKYIELIPKALAFRPIDELNKFVFDFLLNEKPVDIDLLRQNVRSYREFESLLDLLKEKEQHLLDIESSYNQYLQDQSENSTLEYLLSLVKIKEIEKRRFDLGTDIKRLEKEIFKSQEKQTELETELFSVSKEIEQIQSLIHSNETYKYYQDLEERITLNDQKRIDLGAIVNDLSEIIENEKNLCKFIYSHVKQDEALQEYNKLTIHSEMDQFAVNQLTKTIKNIYEDIKRDLTIDCNELKMEKIRLEEELKEVNEEMTSLQKQQFKFDYAVTRLKELIEEDIKKITNKDVNVRVLCELINVNDETWRNALEGYLNTQRFDLIVDPIYFDEALKVYEKYKYKEKLFGVGLVNTNELDIYKHVVPDSLASKVETDKLYARYYVNMLLNNVMCVDDVTDLKKYKTSITKTCMVYKNYTARQIREEVYKKPYIGISAMQLQLERLKDRKQELEERKIVVLKELTQKEFYFERLKANQLDYIGNNFLKIAEFTRLENETKTLKQQLINFKLNPEFQSITNTLENKQERQKEINDSKKQLILLEGKLCGEKSNKEEFIQSLGVQLTEQCITYDKLINNDLILKQQIEEEYNKIEQEQKGDINRITKYCTDKMRLIHDGLNRQSVMIVTKLNDFNHTYHTGFSPTLDCIKQYLDELNKIRNYEILQYEEKARASRINCEVAFKEQFISKLRENILLAQEELDTLNNALKGKKFGGDEYEFVYKTSSNYHYEMYYNLIMSDENYFTNTLFSESLNDQNRIILKELFDKLVVDKDNSEAEKSLEKFCDYRNYMSYDIKIHHKNGDYTLFSKVSREKSGGETQTPFYVVIAASFEQLLTDRKRSSTACFVMFDEAFNNMDESRIQAMMEFYANLNFQLMIAVPPQRIETIIEHVNTTLIVLKDGEQSFIEAFQYQKK